MTLTVDIHWCWHVTLAGAFHFEAHFFKHEIVLSNGYHMRILINDQKNGFESPNCRRSTNSTTDNFENIGSGDEENLEIGYHGIFFSCGDNYSRTNLGARWLYKYKCIFQMDGFILLLHSILCKPCLTTKAWRKFVFTCIWYRFIILFWVTNDARLYDIHVAPTPGKITFIPFPVYLCSARIEGLGISRSYFPYTNLSVLLLQNPHSELFTIWRRHHYSLAASNFRLHSRRMRKVGVSIPSCDRTKLLK